MPPELTDLTDQILLRPYQALGIPIALVGAVFLSLGAQFQHRGVAKVEEQNASSTAGLSLGQLTSLLGRPSWVIGTMMLALAIVLQLTSLGFAPLIVVQPLGAIALVITSILNARVSHVPLNRRSIRAIALCVGGVGLFVTIAAFTAVDRAISDTQLVTILIILAAVLIAFVASFLALRHQFRAVYYIIGAGVLYGFVATLAKVVINRILQGDFEWLTLTCLAGLLAAGALGAYFVQTAYSAGPPDLVIAGLTVVDPLVAVGIGILVLGEASQAPWYAAIAFVVAGIIAVLGVFDLAKNHPQAQH
ncbi:MAG: multidrug transporter permease [Naasia sp.]|uniref:DMT family transporter n=1 Tax=Naasia sp. TaxID=2546198 RepID=UPI00260EA571|nr:DMT family transporter [Naasia sp.]MCU1570043.1 multidrug transporter permease [Naasia sp.]